MRLSIYPWDIVTEMERRLQSAGAATACQRNLAPGACIQCAFDSAGMMRFMKSANSGTVKAVSPWAGL